ncbi:hypothetical protein WDZ92_24195, partial [Nostoc sp. NIES-2111]
QCTNQIYLCNMTQMFYALTLTDTVADFSRYVEKSEGVGLQVRKAFFFFPTPKTRFTTPCLDGGFRTSREKSGTKSPLMSEQDYCCDLTSDRHNQAFAVIPVK